MPSDADLVRAAQGGDAMSLGLLLERHRAPLHALALQILGYGPEAEDATQEAFIIALRKIGQVREPEAVGGWLRMVLRNVCRTRLRAGRGEVLFGEPANIERRFCAASLEEAIDRLAMRDWVWTAMAELPETLRVTAMLRYFGSYASSYEEISAVLGVPVGTVRSRLSRVKVNLADALLESAGLAHDGARKLTEGRARYFGAAAEEMNRGEGYDLLAGIHAEETTVVLPGGRTFRGRRVVAEDLESDLLAHTKMHPTNIIASKDITVFEFDIESPRDDPFRCPPAATQVHFQRDGLTRRVHIHFAPRTETEEG